MDIIKKLNDLRLSQNMSVYRLSELSGINQSTLANTFSRGIIPSVENLAKICETLGKNLSQFFSEDEVYELLSKEETELLQNYRKLSKATKKSVQNLLEDLSSQYPNG